MAATRPRWSLNRSAPPIQSGRIIRRGPRPLPHRGSVHLRTILDTESGIAAGIGSWSPVLLSLRCSWTFLGLKALARAPPRAFAGRRSQNAAGWRLTLTLRIDKRKQNKNHCVFKPRDLILPARIDCIVSGLAG